jgi:putative transposase
MVKNHKLAKSISDVAWSEFFDFLTYKVEYTDRQIAKVRPNHTSQDCHKCGHRRTDLKLSDRIYHCSNPACKLVIDRDINAALNILALGLQSIGLTAIEAPSFS